MRGAKAAIFCLLLACAQPVLAAGPASALRGYRLQYRAVVEGVKDNLSGLAYDARSGHLLALVNRPATLLVLDTDGRVLRSVALRGFEDTEGVALLTDGRVAVTEEGRNTIAVFAMPEDGVDHVDHASAVSWSLGEFARGNNGFEGLATGRACGCVWVVKERKPRGLYKACSNGDAAYVGDQSAWLRGANAGTDLSGIEFDPQSGHLLLLSDESARITEIDLRGRVLAHRSLGGAHEPRPPQPEGIAVDGKGRLYIVSEPNLFYRYSRK